jgi:hypothetical protein
VKSITVLDFEDSPLRDLYESERISSFNEITFFYILFRYIFV